MKVPKLEATHNGNAPHTKKTSVFGLYVVVGCRVSGVGCRFSVVVVAVVVGGFGVVVYVTIKCVCLSTSHHRALSEKARA